MVLVIPLEKHLIDTEYYYIDQNLIPQVKLTVFTLI